jgi:uncharacterized protein (DUF488 family)
MSTAADGPALLTLGHGTLDSAGLGDLLQSAGVDLLVDVRRFPGSRTNPAATRPALEDLTGTLGIGYRWEERLGGRRRLARDDPGIDSWWQVAQFRAYAAWTRTADFRSALEELLGQLTTSRTAVMCSESVWWRCHRRLIADVVVAEQGAQVLHLMHDGRLTPHTVSEGARRGEDGRLVWDASESATPEG